MFGEDSRGDADGCRRAEDAEEEAARIHELPPQREHADGRAADERADDAADADNRSDNGIFEECADIRLKTGDEQQNDGADDRDAVQLGIQRDGLCADDREEAVSEGFERQRCSSCLLSF